MSSPSPPPSHPPTCPHLPPLPSHPPTCPHLPPPPSHPPTCLHHSHLFIFHHHPHPPTCPHLTTTLTPSYMFSPSTTTLKALHMYTAVWGDSSNVARRPDTTVIRTPCCRESTASSDTAPSPANVGVGVLWVCLCANVGGQLQYHSRANKHTCDHNTPINPTTLSFMITNSYSYKVYS